MKNIFFCIALLLSACTSQTGKFSNAEIISQRSQNPHQLCQHFELSDRDALAFFTRATEISAMAMHDQYDYLPCEVIGIISFKSRSSGKPAICDFSIRAGGTAELTCSAAEVRLFGCPTCGDLLRDAP